MARWHAESSRRRHSAQTPAPSPCPHIQTLMSVLGDALMRQTSGCLGGTAVDAPPRLSLVRSRLRQRPPLAFAAGRRCAGDAERRVVAQGENAILRAHEPPLTHRLVVLVVLVVVHVAL